MSFSVPQQARCALQRVVDYVPISKESSTVLLLIAGWYFCSISLSLYNKWMLDPQYGLKLPYPLFITSVHQFLLWGISFLYIKIRAPRAQRQQQIELQRLGSPDVQSESYTGQQLAQTGTTSTTVPPTVSPTVPAIDRRQKLIYYMKYIVPTAVASAGDIGFGNLSFKYVPLTIYTVVKSSSIAFVLLFGCLFKLERYHWKLGVVVGVMFVGVVCMAFKPDHAQASSAESEENKESRSEFIFGVVCVLLSACLSGLRWVYTQIVLKKKDSAIPTSTITNTTNTNGISNVNLTSLDDNKVDNKIDIQTAIRGKKKNKQKKKKKNPVYTIHQLAPIMGFTLLLTSLIVERPDFNIIFIKLFTLNTGNFDLKHFFIGILLILFPGAQVFFMTICEFGILQRSKVLTLSIAGIFKELITILVSMIVLHEHIETIVNWIGMVIILLDVCYYNWYRYMEKIETTDLNSSQNEQLFPHNMNTVNGDDSINTNNIGNNKAGSRKYKLLPTGLEDVETTGSSLVDGNNENINIGERHQGQQQIDEDDETQENDDAFYERQLRDALIIGQNTSMDILYELDDSEGAEDLLEP